MSCLLLYSLQAYSQYTDTACVGEIGAGYKVISTPGSNYQWFVKGGTIASGQGTNDIQINWGNVPGIYDVQVLETNSGSCTGDTVTAKILLINNPIVSILSDDSVCAGEPILLTASGAARYFWNGIEGSNSLVIIPQNDTNITLRGMIAGCSSLDISKKIIAVPKPIASFTFKPSDWLINDVLEVTFNGSNANRFVWYVNNDMISDGDKKSFSKALKDSGELTLTLWVFGQLDCSDSMQYVGRVYSGWTVFAPTAFTPNNDGVNDVFGIEYFGYKRGSITIYNRYGMPVFNSNQLDFGWDGSINGSPQASDIYTYELIVYDRFDRARLITGKFNLIR
ncbi:MAG: T9SS type B sorting domain-containing protein [Bacteroidia bacterium]